MFYTVTTSDLIGKSTPQLRKWSFYQWLISKGILCCSGLGKCYPCVYLILFRLLQLTVFSISIALLSFIAQSYCKMQLRDYSLAKKERNHITSNHNTPILESLHCPLQFSTLIHLCPTLVSDLLSLLWSQGDFWSLRISDQILLAVPISVEG